jgi:hypothetical protein
MKLHATLRVRRLRLLIADGRIPLPRLESDSINLRAVRRLRQMRRQQVIRKWKGEHSNARYHAFRRLRLFLGFQFSIVQNSTTRRLGTDDESDSPQFSHAVACCAFAVLRKSSGTSVGVDPDVAGVRGLRNFMQSTQSSHFVAKTPPHLLDAKGHGTSKSTRALKQCWALESVVDFYGE